MTRKLFWTDPYLTRLETQVTLVEGRDVRLEETIFFAFSGGQESDAGSIGGHAVREARKDAADIVYSLDQSQSLQTGDAVTVLIDWDRRYRLMRLHFAAELILELACRRLAGVEKIGAHIAADKARIDFRWDENLGPLLPALAADASAMIAADQAIVSAFSDEATQRRYWELPGFARVPCGGTHLRRTGEVGAIALKRRNVGKGKERIEVYLA
jgi:Ser-tRNA(Ala) deacylase AlaX